MKMRRKLIMLLASCSLAVLIILPVGTVDSGVVNTQVLIQVNSHGAGD